VAAAVDVVLTVGEIDEPAEPVYEPLPVGVVDDDALAVLVRVAFIEALASAELDALGATDGEIDADGEPVAAADALDDADAEAAGVDERLAAALEEAAALAEIVADADAFVDPLGEFEKKVVGESEFEALAVPLEVATPV